MSTLKPTPRADRLQPSVWVAVQAVLEPLRAGGKVDHCPHVSDLSSAGPVTVCVDDRPPMLRCFVCTRAHQERHITRSLADDDAPCRSCGHPIVREFESRPELTEHTWEYDPDLPAVKVAVTCIFTCPDCWER